ncbi:helix-turn-helix domain-containing protein [Cryobacterium sp. GrIS_2_6]|uniref:helix-turn-helix domain-containing protein n=1 Tax=Cryobacterium sp. GrIS_2_6 TaxID=3162785 RepID=UPI002E02CE4D|nr:excisionase family DNA binding protein [Cryobacterium psychrotolerans]
MTTVSVSDVSTDQLRTLESTRDQLPSGTLKSALDSMATELRRGENVLVLAEGSSVTPSEAARFLGLSRTHLYKVLDSGALPFFVVGVRDKRILGRDLVAYQSRMFHAQSQTALAFAGGSASEDAALDEMS